VARTAERNNTTTQTHAADMRTGRMTALVAAIGALLLLGGASVEAGRARLQPLRRAATAVLAQPQGDSTCGFSADGYNYDLSSLMGKDMLGSNGTPEYQFYLSVCGALSSSAASTCTQIDPTASACQLEVQGGAQTFDLGNWSPSAPPQWSFINESDPSLGAQYQLSGAPQCWANGGSPQPYKTTVQFQCAKEEGDVKVQQSPQSCDFTFVVPTPHACPSSPPPAPGCSWNGYDMTSLMGTDLVGSDGSSLYSYYLSVCGAVSSAAASACVKADPTSSVCQVQVQGVSQSFDLGNWHADALPQWSFIDASAPILGVQYQLVGAQQCYAQGDAELYVSTVQFQCARAQGDVKVQQYPNSCDFTVVVPTPLACPPIPPPPIECSWNGYDLSSLMGTDLVGSDGGSQYAYYMSVCGALSSTAAASCVQGNTDASACQLQVQGGAQAFDLGNWDESAAQKWSYIDAKLPAVGIQYQLTGATQCSANGGSAQPYNTTVQFQCARAQSNGFKVVHDTTACSTTFIFATPLACPAPA